MITSSPLGEDYGYFKGLGGLSGGSNSSVLPPQAIPKSKKGDKWKRACLDGLEREGIKQYTQNLKFEDMYNMISGKLAYMDLSDEEDISDPLFKNVIKFKKDKLNIPKYIRHYDLMYPIVSKIVGDWSMHNHKLRFDTTDESSTNDFIRERTFKLMKYSEAMFQSELRKIMLLNGFDFSETGNAEEDNLKEQERQKIIEEYFPDKLDSFMKKNFKTEAAEWSEKTFKRDYERYRMNVLESLEARDILLTGKSARHYRVGYDYYFPEYWHPIEVFHSKEASITRLEDAEFAGRIKWYTVTELMNTYGDILSEKERVSIYKAVFGPEYESYGDIGTSFEKNTSLLGEGRFQQMTVPFKGYSEHKMAVEFEEATGIPLSEHTDVKTGVKTPIWTNPFITNQVSMGAQLAQSLRNDIEIRTDTIQVTEAYWKGSQKIGILTRRTESGYLDTVEVDEDLLKEYLSKYNIKNVKTKSLAEYNIMSDEDKENTVVWVDTPVVHRGVKIRVSGIGLDSDIYKEEVLPYQIRGEKGNIFDVKLPVCGAIGNSYCELIAPYQKVYNYLMNQNFDYLQKEIGAFFVIDVNVLPLEFFNVPDGEDALYEFRDIAKSTGLLPTDFSRNNLNQNGGLTFNPMTYNNATFTEPISRNIQLAQQYKAMAYETLGLNPTIMGTPSQYSTVEGIQAGQRAYFAQTYGIEQHLMENKRANTEVHMSVAQYCQLNKKDANYIYFADNSEIEFLQAIKDEDFALRQIDVRSTYDPNKQNMFQQLRNTLLQNNTMGSDANSLIELYLSDDFMELREASIRARLHAEKMQQQQMEHQSQMAREEREFEAKKHKDIMDLGYAKIQGSIQAKELDSLGRAADRQADDSYLKAIAETADANIEAQRQLSKDQVEQMKLNNDYISKLNDFNAKAADIKLKEQKLNIEREKLATQRYVADVNHKNSVINKN